MTADSRWRPLARLWSLVCRVRGHDPEDPSVPSVAPWCARCGEDLPDTKEAIRSLLEDYYDPDSDRW